MKYCNECGEYYSTRTIKGMCGKCYQRAKNKTEVNALPSKGEIKYTKAGKIVCHICGQSYTRLLTHVRQIHKISASDYKRMYGLDLCSGIITEESKELSRAAVYENYDKVVIGNLVNNPKSKKTRFKPGDTGRTADKVSLQTMKRLKQQSFIKSAIK